MTRPLLLLALALALASTGCETRGAKASLPARAAGGRSVRVARPATRIETGLARVTGTVRAKNEAVLAAKATGQIKRVLVGVGDRVRAGTRLVEMDASNAAIALENGRAAERLATAALENADKELARGTTLSASGAVPDATLDRLKTGRELAAAQLDQARAGRRLAEQMLRDTVLTAPFDGVVTRKLQNAGNTVTLMPVSPILAITDLDHLEVQLAVPEVLDPLVAVGDEVAGVTSPNGQAFTARVRAKSGAVDPITRTVEVLADVLPGSGPRIKANAIATLDLSSGGGASLFVPSSAVRREGSAAWVFRVAGGKAERRDVQVAPVHPGTYAVKGGLDATSDVILDPGALSGGEAVVPLAD